MRNFADTTIDAHGSSSVCCNDAAEKISVLRQSIDNIDNAVIALLAERFKITQRVGEIKAEAGFAPADMKREEQQVQRLLKLADAAGLDSSLALKYHEFVVTEAKKRHQQMQS